jgi:protein O-mannosyl-transferase
MLPFNQLPLFKRFFSSITTRKAITIIIFVGVIIYCNTLSGNFVWDDINQIQQNTFIKSLSNYPLFFQNSNAYGLNTMGYRPLMFLAFSFVYSFFGLQTFPFHTFQLTIHILNAILLYLIFNIFFSNILSKGESNLSENKRGKQLKKYDSIIIESLKSQTNLLSLFLSLMFLVHPIQVEAVAYISGLNDTLFIFFGLLAFLLSLKDRINTVTVTAIGLLLLCSLLSKEAGILFLFMVLYSLYFFKKTRTLVYLTVGCGVFFTYAFLRFIIAGAGFTKLFVPIANLSFVERLANIPAIVLYYLGIIFFPLRLAIDQQWVITTISVQNFYFPLCIITIAFVILVAESVFIYIRKRQYFTIFAYFLLWFFSGLLLYLQIFPLDMTVADRWMDFPLIGILGMMGVGVQIHLSKQIKMKVIYISIGVILVVLLSVRTVIRNTNFHDQLTLLSHDTKVQDNAWLENDLGAAYYQTRNLQEAFIHQKKSVELRPFSGNLYNLALDYRKMQNIPQAIAYYAIAATAVDTKVLHGEPLSATDLKIYINLAGLFLFLEKYNDAEIITKKGLHYFPNSGTLWVELAYSEYKLQRQEEALVTLHKAQSFGANKYIDYMYNLILNKQDIPLSLVTNYIKENSSSPTP